MTDSQKLRHDIIMRKITEEYGEAVTPSIFRHVSETVEQMLDEAYDEGWLDCHDTI